MLKKSTKEMFQTYLRQAKLDESLQLDSNGLIRFHWANDPLSANFMKDHFGSDTSDLQRISELEFELNRLKDHTIWLMSKRGQLQSDLYNLYQCYLDPRLKSMWFDIDEVLFSMTGEAGPYSSLKSMRWFDRSIYAKFIYLKMIRSWAPQRSFRMSLSLPIEIRAEGSPLNSMEAKIHQLSSHGMLIHANSYQKAKQWECSDIVFIKKQQGLERDKSIERSLQSLEWASHINNFTITNNEFQEILDFKNKAESNDSKFIFIPFEKMNLLSIKSTEQALNELNSLVEDARSTIHKYVGAA